MEPLDKKNALIKIRRSLDDSLRSGIHPRLNNAVGESNPVDVAAKRHTLRRQKLSSIIMGKKHEMSEVQSF